MIYGIIFDMDGVLLDSAPQHFESWRLMAEQTGAHMTEDFFNRTFGQTNQVILPQLFGRPLSPEEIEHYANIKEEIYRDLVRGNVQPLPGLPHFVESLAREGWRIAVGSSGPRLNVELIVSELGLDRYVSVCVCAEDVKHGKPDPEVFLMCAEKLGIPPGRCVVVEDSIHGLEAAMSAGMKCIAITTTNLPEKLRGADLIIDAFDEATPEIAARLLDGKANR